MKCVQNSAFFLSGVLCVIVKSIGIQDLKTAERQNWMTITIQVIAYGIANRQAILEAWLNILKWVSCDFVE